MNELHHFRNAQANGLIFVMHTIAITIAVPIAIAASVTVAVSVTVTVAVSVPVAMSVTVPVAMSVATAVAIRFDGSHCRNCNHAVHGHQLAHGECYISKLCPFLA